MISSHLIEKSRVGNEFRFTYKFSQSLFISTSHYCLFHVALKYNKMIEIILIGQIAIL